MNDKTKNYYTMKQVCFLMVLIVAGMVRLPAQSNKMVEITGKCDFLKDGDSVRLTIEKYGSPLWSGQDPRQRYDKSYTSRVIGNVFKFKFPTYKYPTKTQIIFEEKNTNRSIFHNLIEEGDNININVSGGNISYSGNGSEKWEIKRALDSIDKIFTQYYHPLEIKEAVLNLRRIDTITTMKLRYLNENGSVLSNNAIIAMKANILGEWLAKEELYLARWLEEDSTKVIILKEIADAGYNANIFTDEVNIMISQHPDKLQYIDVFTNALIAKYSFDSCIVVGKPFRLDKCYHFFSTNYNGPIRDRIVFNLLYTRRILPIDISGYVKDAVAYMTNKELKNVLTDYLASRGQGATAYDFSLPDVNGRIHRLSDYRGKVVFIDFWTTFCGNCIAVAPYLAKIEEYFKDKPVAFISINCDPQKNLWLKSLKSGKYASQDIVNVFTEGQGEKHTVVKEYEIGAYPTLLLVDKSGKIMPVPVDPRNDDGKNITELINHAINQ